jgi:hypothetical protein
VIGGLQRILRKIRHLAMRDGAAFGACTVQPLWLEWRGSRLDATYLADPEDYKPFTATCLAADMNPIRGAPVIAACPDAC